MHACIFWQLLNQSSSNHRVAVQLEGFGADGLVALLYMHIACMGAFLCSISTKYRAIYILQCNTVLTAKLPSETQDLIASFTRKRAY